MKMVLVEWDDAASGVSWDSRGAQEHIGKVISFGVLIREDDKEVEIVPNLAEANKLHQIAIPKGSIKRMRRLRL